MQPVMRKRGRITIPAPTRHMLGIQSGTRIHIQVDEQRRFIILTPITRRYISSLRGKYKGRGLLRAWMTEKEGE